MTKGLDLSNFQDTSSVDVAKREGCAFVILKVSEGSGFVDTTYPAKLRRARELGLRVGTYHFWRPGPVGPQVALFVGHAVGPGYPHVGDLVPALDVEVGPYDAAGAAAWLSAVEHVVAGRRQVSDARPMIYSNRSGFGELAKTHGIAELVRYPQWLATGGGLQGPAAPWRVAVLEQTGLDPSHRFDFDTGSDLSSVIYDRAQPAPLVRHWQCIVNGKAVGTTNHPRRYRVGLLFSNPDHHEVMFRRTGH